MSKGGALAGQGPHAPQSAKPPTKTKQHTPTHPPGPAPALARGRPSGKSARAGAHALPARPSGRAGARCSPRSAPTPPMPSGCSRVLNPHRTRHQLPQLLGEGDLATRAGRRRGAARRQPPHARGLPHSQTPPPPLMPWPLCGAAQRPSAPGPLRAGVTVAPPWPGGPARKEAAPLGVKRFGRCDAAPERCAARGARRGAAPCARRAPTGRAWFQIHHTQTARDFQALAFPRRRSAARTDPRGRRAQLYEPERLIIRTYDQHHLQAAPRQAQRLPTRTFERSTHLFAGDWVVRA